MNIDRLRYFAAVVETGQMRKASELVGIAPASMSKAIALLEQELGAKLIRPEGRGIEITERGRELYRNSAALLDEYRRFRERAQAVRALAAPRKLRLASFEVFTSYFLSAFLCEAISEEDALVLEMTPGELENAILDGIVDYGLTYLPQPQSKLDFAEIGSLQMAIFGRPEWQRRPFAEWPFAVPTTEVRIHAQDHLSLDLWPEGVMSGRRIKYQFELLETALQTAGAGQAVLHCPEFVVKLHNRIMKTERALQRLPYPKGLKLQEAKKVYLVSAKGDERARELERKLARFFRVLAR